MATSMRESAKSRTSEIFLVCSIPLIHVRCRGLPLCIHGRFEDYGYGEANNQEIGDDVARTHSNELSVAFPAFRTWIGEYLPIVVERLTFGKSCDDNSDKGNG